MESLSGTRAQEYTVLALNCGSSSLKFGIYFSDGETARAFCEGEAEEIGSDTDYSAALARALESLNQKGAPEFDAIGHRFVHGGSHFREHQQVTPEVLFRLRAVVDYAPLHMPTALAVLETMQKNAPAKPQVVCFDTAFHRTMPDVSKTYALPGSVRELGVERYGFHGLSLESIVAQLHPLPDRLVVAHLGNGASVTAIRNGRSIDTTMGLTPTGGVMMGTRCGDLDPGLMVYLMRHGYANPDVLETLFDRHSGLLGVSGITSDVRQLLNKRTTDKQADLALKMFCYQVRKAIASMAGALSGVDAVVFTGGIGEHADELRKEISTGLEFLGDIRIMTLPSQEDLQIAKITAKLIA
ncbi:MAG: acetate/propionate family kinase [Acidobacteriaceae bacterium]|nr:acetate/propionate family kinase [Acidobacteriaceae bacterium]MBV9782073.1 acetate/propionate family kinase [Acidobacteriaceae bacterium]